MASSLAFALVLAALPFLAVAQTSPAAAPAPSALPNPVAILTNATQYTTLLKLLTDRNLVDAIANQLPKGLTIFAPTDNAFKDLPAGLLNKLTTDQQTLLLQYHVLAKYVDFDSLKTLSNPVQTLASGLTFNITGGNNQANISTGEVNTRVNSPLYDDSPLAIFPLDHVLIPLRFVSTAPAGAPKSPAGAGGPSASAPRPSAASFEGRRLGWGVIAGAGLACLSFI